MTQTETFAQAGDTVQLSPAHTALDNNFPDPVQSLKDLIHIAGTAEAQINQGVQKLFGSLELFDSDKKIDAHSSQTTQAAGDSPASNGPKAGQDSASGTNLPAANGTAGDQGLQPGIESPIQHDNHSDKVPPEDHGAQPGKEPPDLHSDRPNQNNHGDAAKEGDTRPAAKLDPVEAEQQRLDSWADAHLPPAESDRFKRDVADFKGRAHKDGVSDEDILKTYQQVERITTDPSTTHLPSDQRDHIAQSVMHNAAHPTEISQGRYNTCNVATVESRTYTRNPSEAAKLVADVTLTGSYTAPDKTTVTVDPTAHDQSLYWNTPLDGTDPNYGPPGQYRSQASEIFQVTATNLCYAKENAKNGTKIKYEQVEPPPGDNGDNGERLWDNSKQPAQEVIDPQTKKPLRGLTDDQIAEVSNAINGKTESDVILTGAENSRGTSIERVNSEDELKAKLKELKDHHQLPVIIQVYAQNEPFYTDSGQAVAGGEGGGHVVTVTDYDEKTGNVSVANQWGKAADHSQGNPISSHDLFIAMQTPSGAEAALAKDVKWNQDHGILDTTKEADFVRHQLENKNFPHFFAQFEALKVIDDTATRLNQPGVSHDEEKRDMTYLNNMIDQLPADARISAAQELFKKGLVNQQQYEDELVRCGREANDEHSKSQLKGMKDTAFLSELEQLRDLIYKLPAADQQMVHDEINSA